MKTELQATVTTYQGSFDFSGTEASAVVSAVKAHQDIKANGTPHGDSEAFLLQIPYTSVVKVEYGTSQVESTTEDDNCKVQTPAEESGGDDSGESGGGDDSGGDSGNDSQS